MKTTCTFILLLTQWLIVYEYSFAQVSIKEFRAITPQSRSVASMAGATPVTDIMALSTDSAAAVIPTGAREQERINYQTITVISDAAFTRLIKRDVTFAVIGNQSPTPGLALDVSDKLSVKLTGRIPSKHGIITADFKASSTESGDIPLFTAGKFNGQVSAGATFHYIPGSTRRISKSIFLGNTYPVAPGADRHIAELKKADGDKYTTAILDTVAVLAYLMHAKQRQGLEVLLETKFTKPDEGDPLLLTYGQVIELAIPGISQTTNPDEPQVLTDVSSGKRLNLLLDLTDTYFSLIKEQDNLVGLAADLKGIDTWKADKLYADLKQSCETYKGRKQIEEEKDIERSDAFWLRKQLNWFSFSLKPVLYTFASFRNDGTQVKASSMTFFEMEIPLWYQFYDVRARGGNLWRIGTTAVVGSNKKLYTTVQYVTRDTLVQYPNEAVITEDKSDGLLDDGTTRQNKLYFNCYLEFYRLPRRDFVPGFGARIISMRDAAFGDDVSRKLRLELNLTINILSSDKDKARITLQPYGYISSLREELMKDGETFRPKTFKEKLNVGIRLSVPIADQLIVGQ